MSCAKFGRLFLLAVMLIAPQSYSADDVDLDWMERLLEAEAVEKIAAPAEQTPPPSPPPASATPPAPPTTSPTVAAPTPTKGQTLPVSALPRAGATPIPAPSSATPAPSATQATTALASENLAEVKLTPDVIARRGLITEKSGGFNNRLWQGLDLAQASRDLQQIQQGGLPSAISQKLLQRALITAADAPQGEGLNWLAQRVNTLHSLGLADAGRAMLRGISQPEQLVPEVAKAWVESNLMTGDTKRACQFVRQQVLNTDHPFWRQAVMVCQVVNGQTEGLRLSLDAAGEPVTNADPTLTKLLHIATGAKVAITDFGRPVLPPLQAVVVRYTPSLLDEKTVALLPDALQRSVMEDTGQSLIMRTEIAERLVASFGLPEDVKALIGLYEEFGFSDNDLIDGASAATKQNQPVAARALLWQAARLPELDTDRALLLQALWQNASRQGLARLNAYLSPDLRRITPSPSLAWFAPATITAQLQHGRLSAALPWWQVLNQNPSLSQELQRQRAELGMVLALVGEGDSLKQLTTWWPNLNLSEPQQQRRAMQVLSLAEAMGYTVPAQYWQELRAKMTTEPTTAAPGELWLRLLSGSMQSGQQGQTLLTLLQPLADQPASQLSAQTLGNIVATLKFMGWTTEAQTLALEALLP